LDKTTLAQLTRGERMVELLKQDQYQPMPVEKQIAVIFLGVNGYLDAIPTNQVGRVQQECLAYLEASYPQVLRELIEKKQISDELRATMNTAASEFMKGFTAKQETKQ
jgi:F-type H+-transporting ATPase subunit alpha